MEMFAIINSLLRVSSRLRRGFIISNKAYMYDYEITLQLRWHPNLHCLLHVLPQIFQSYPVLPN